MDGMVFDGMAYDFSVTTGSNEFSWGMKNSHNATAGTGLTSKLNLILVH